MDFDQIIKNRIESNRLIGELNLSKEFSDFNNHQYALHQQSLKKYQTTKQGFIVAALTATIASMGIMASSSATVPVLGTAIALSYASFAGFGFTKLAETIKQNSYDKNIENSNHFLNAINSFRKSFGKKEYEKFVNETIDNNPNLANALSSANKTFRNIKEKIDIKKALQNTEDSFSKVARKNNLKHN